MAAHKGKPEYVVPDTEPRGSNSSKPSTSLAWGSADSAAVAFSDVWAVGPDEELDLGAEGEVSFGAVVDIFPPILD